MPHSARARRRFSRHATTLFVLVASIAAGSARAGDPPAAGGGEYSVSLPNGLKLELLGVSTSPSRDMPWWKPDGSLLEAPPYEHLGTSPGAAPGEKCYELAVRVTGLKEGETLQRGIDGGKYYVNGGAAPYVGDKEVPDLRAFFVSIPAQEAAATLEFGAGANEWKTVRTFNGPGTYGEGPDKVTVTKPEGRAARRRGVSEKEPEIQLLVRVMKTDKALRLVAVDADGKQHLSRGSQWWGGDDQGVDGAFPDVPPERAKEYRLETCPFHKVAFRDVKLRPSDPDAAAARATEWRVARLRGQEDKAAADPGTAKRIAEAMFVLRGSRVVFDDPDAWARAIRDLLEIGPPAVPALVAELNRTAKPYVRSNMAIVLRGIGDVRAVPGLATALASTSFAPNDYGGMRIKDEGLKKYLARCVRMDGYGANFGRPVNEITESLVSLTGGHSEGDQHRMKNDRALYAEASLKWSQWWDQNRAVLLRGLPEQRGAFDNAGKPVDLLASLDGLEQRFQQQPAMATERVAGEWTRLHVAAMAGRLAEASLLMANGAKINAAVYGWTPLHLAAASGALDVVNRLLEKGADVKARTPDGCTPLHAAVGLGLSPAHTRILYQPEPEVVRLLLARDADVNAKDAAGQTPLYGAASFDNRAVTGILLKAKADPRAADAHGRTPLHRAAECGAAEVADALLDAGADVNAVDDKGYGPIQIAGYSIHYRDFNPPMVPFLLSRGAKVSLAALASLGTAEDVAARLKQDPASVNAPAPKSETDEEVRPLNLAMQRGDAAIVKLLLDSGADPNTMRYGQTPLTAAVQAKRRDLVELLLAAKAKVDLYSNGQGTPLGWAGYTKDVEMARLLLDAGAAVDPQLDADSSTPLQHALQVDRGQTEEQAVPIVELLLSRGADPNRVDKRSGYTPIFLRGEVLGAVLLKHGAKLDVRANDGQTPLHIATILRRESDVKFLLANNVDVNARNDAGKTPLHEAFKLQASPPVIDLLLKAGADVNAKDKEGRTPLHDAMQRGTPETVTQLLDAKAHPNAPDKDGAAPLHIAAKLKRKDSIELLLAHGADAGLRDKAGRTPADWAPDEATRKLLRPAATAK